MRHALLDLCIVLLLSAPPVWAQSSAGSSGENDAIGGTLAENRPAENVRGGAVWERAPGRIIDMALARHRSLRDARLGAQRTHDTAALAPESVETGSFSDLLGGSLSNLLNTFVNTGLAGTLGSQTGGSQLPGGSTTGTGLPPEVIQMLQAFGIDPKQLANAKTLDETDGTAVVGSNTQSKTGSRSQTSDTQQEREFVVRWADAMLSTVFTALTIGFQTQDFIDVLKDAFRPLFIPQDAEPDGAPANGTPAGNGGDGTGNGGEEPLI